jgi:hypothetical protein
MITSTSISKGGLGRFGNQLFTIAGVIGIADRNKQNFGFGKWMNYDNALFGDPVDDMSLHFENPLPDDRGQMFAEYGYFWGYRDIDLPQGNWSINAHLQSPKFFENSIDKVRYYFRMKDEPPQNDFVAIHYRAGDYIDNPEAYHPRCSKEYYREAIKHFLNERFMIFSDDMKAAVEMFSGLCKFRVAATPNYLTDFRLMKRCKSFIIANSSFSAMAAILGEDKEKQVVAPSRWFGTQANGLDASDIYDKTWRVI